MSLCSDLYIHCLSKFANTVQPLDWHISGNKEWPVYNQEPSYSWQHIGRVLS